MQATVTTTRRRGRPRVESDPAKRDMYLVWYGLRELTGLPAARLARSLAEIAANHSAGPRAVQLGIARAKTFPEVARRRPAARHAS